MDGRKSASSPYLDVRVTVYVKGRVSNWHLLAIPMCESHTGEHMFNLLATLLDSLVLDWRNQLIGVTSDGASSMTGLYRGVFTRLQRVAITGFYRLWRAAHQLDIAVKKTFRSKCDESFVNILALLSGYLRRQQNLVLEMKSKCSFVHTRWISMSKVLKWLVANRIRIVAYLEEKQAQCTPPDNWWVTVIVLNRFLPIVDRAFCGLQGKNLLVASQTAILNELLLEVLEMGAVDGPFASGEISAVQHPNYVRGRFTMSMQKARHFVDSCGVFAMERIQSMSHEQNGMGEGYASILRSISVMFVDAVHGVESITVARDANNKRFSEELPAVTPITLQQTDRAAFSRQIM
jgi:hypothetical protein